MDQAMNNTTYEWRRQLIWKHAQNPELGLPFQIFATFWLFLCILIGISANALVIRAFYQNKSLRTPFNSILVNLSCADFLMMSIGIPLDVVAAINGGWCFSTNVCDAIGFIMTFTGMGSLYTLMALSIQRCFYVYDPAYASINGSECASVLLGIIWTLASAISLPPLFGWSEFVPESSGLSCAPSWHEPTHQSYAWYLVTLGFLIPVTIICVTSIIILLKVKEHTTKQRVLNMNKQAIQKRERKVTYMVMLMFVAFMGAWGPYASICLIRLLFGIETHPLLVGYAMLAAKTSGVLNPVIFILMNSQFRKLIIPHWMYAKFKKLAGKKISSNEDENPAEKNREMKRNDSQVFNSLNSHDIPLVTLRQSETTLGFITTLGYNTSMVGSASFDPASQVTATERLTSNSKVCSV